jgi:hypothetical protein
MSLQGKFTNIYRDLARTADRNARMRDANQEARQQAGAAATPGTFVGSVKRYGLWGITAWDDFYWR